MSGTYIYYPLGRFSDGRTPMLTRTDLYLEYNLKLGGKYGLQLNANISNLFNHKIFLRKWEFYNQHSTELWHSEMLAGFDYQELCAQQGVLLDPRFLKPSAYTPPIDVLLGIKFIF